MKKLLFITYSLASIVLAPAQTWTKISGIADTTTIEGIAEINNRLVICGRANVGNSVNFFSSFTGDDWTKLPTFSFPAYYIFGLPKNNIILGTGFLSSYKLLNNTWSTVFGANAFAEFPNGTIIGGQANYPDSIYTFAPTGTKGKSIGGFKFKFGPKYGVGNNGRVFLFSYGSGFGYIDQSDLSKIKFPATLNGTTMTETSWQSYIIADLEKTSDGTLFAVDRLGLAGIIKSTDNGVTWNTILSGIYAPSIAINFII